MDFVKKSDLIDLITLAKVMATHHDMTPAEACHAIKYELQAYSSKVVLHDKSTDPLATSIPPWEQKEIADEIIDLEWWLYPEREKRFVGYWDIDDLSSGHSANQIAISIDDIEERFHIDRATLKHLVANLNAPQTNQPAPSAEHSAPDTAHHSHDLNTLIRAANKFWRNADPHDKDTHPINATIEDWLCQQGFSKICAKQGAVIIRPQWAAQGRPASKSSSAGTGTQCCTQWAAQGRPASK